MKIHRILTHVCLHHIGCLSYCCYAITSSPAVQIRHSKVYGNPIAPSLYSILLDHIILLFTLKTNRTAKINKPLWGGGGRGGCSHGFGIAPCRVLELLPGFRSKMWKSIRIFIKSSVKGYFKTENRKKGSAPPFLPSLFRYLQKKSQISVQVACGDHIVLINQTDDICFRLKIIGKCKQNLFF